MFSETLEKVVTYRVREIIFEMNKDEAFAQDLNEPEGRSRWMGPYKDPETPKKRIVSSIRMNQQLEWEQCAEPTQMHGRAVLKKRDPLYGEKMGGSTVYALFSRDVDGWGISF